MGVERTKAKKKGILGCIPCIFFMFVYYISGFSACQKQNVTTIFIKISRYFATFCKQSVSSAKITSLTKYVAYFNDSGTPATMNGQITEKWCNVTRMPKNNCINPF